ncbi:amino acid ABC transporter permease [Actinotalea sp. C106]|uniref:amino acid ABC transporter permease n=1 Tax=Actinotalea sp. C106 TaxID=2908644 RepID=UPI0020288CC6|nr:amino acid ABC transporter permease [Actinotalea sp. C106]
MSETTGARPWSPSPLALERAAFRRAQRRRSGLVALVSTALVVTAVVLVVVGAPGWERARTAFFDPENAWAALPAILEGLWLNLRVWVIAGTVGTLLGLALAVLRTSRIPALFPVRALAIGYIDLFRGVPVLLVLYLVGFALPALRLEWLPTSSAFLGALAIVLTYTAYLAEVFRAGIESVHPSQVAAARSLGLSRAQSMRTVVLPQAVRNVTAPLANNLISLQKDSGLISVLGAVDAIRAAQIATTGTYNFTPYVVAGLLFFLVSFPLTRAVDAYQRRRGWGRSLATVTGGGDIR